MFEVFRKSKTIDFSAQYADVTTEYLKFRKYLPWEVPPSSLEPIDKAKLSKDLIKWLESVRSFLNAVVETPPSKTPFQDGVTIRNRTENVINELSKQIEIPQRLSQDILSFPRFFKIDFGFGRQYDFSQDMFSYNIGFWKVDTANLQNQDSNQVLEIGCYEGYATCWMIENLLRGPKGHIVCVDLFYDGFFGTFQKNIEATGKKSQVTIEKGVSQSILRKFPREPRFDFIYVDGSHTSKDCMEDMVLAWPLLKSGGLMIIDDYTLQCPETSALTVKEAVDAFTKFNSSDLEIIRQTYQLTLKKK